MHLSLLTPMGGGGGGGGGGVGHMWGIWSLIASPP